MGEQVLAVDLGGTRMRAAVVDDGGAVAERRTRPTPQDAECPDALLALAGDLIGEGAVGTAVIGVPGRVDHARGRLEHAPNLPRHWPGALDQRLLRDRLGVDVALANDADLAAVGEAYHGAGRGHDDVVYLTVSTGVGAGVLLGKRLVRGHRSLAEVGHTVIDRGAAREDRPATVEELGSGTALERAARERGLDPDGARIVELVHEGDPEAGTLWEELVAVVALTVVNLAHLLSPEAIVLGGGVGRNGDLLLPPLRRALAERGPVGLDVSVAVAALGDDAALVGAAAWHEATGKRPR